MPATRPIKNHTLTNSNRSLSSSYLHASLNLLKNYFFILKNTSM